MSVTVKAANVWRVLRDVNLEAIRASAEARFVLPLVGDDRDVAEGLRLLLSGDGTVPHPWVFTLAAAEGLPELPLRPIFGVLVAHGRELSPALSATRAQFVRNEIGVITILIADPEPPAVPAVDERARLTAPSLDTRLARDLARTLARLAGPDARLALARQLPPLRPPVLDAVIEETAQANAGYALATGLAETVPVLTAPMNLGDLVVLTKNQLVMSYRLALACGRDGDPRRLIPEILGVLGGGLLFRQLARELIGLVPVLGLVPKVAIAYGGTYAIGRAIAAWALEGHEVSPDTVARFSREGLERGRDVARALTEGMRAATQRSRWEAFRRQIPFARRSRS
jgi:uncharacterized protein (DUF697 family)